jgi:hypothetical protein
MNITNEQIAAGRVLLKMAQRDIAEALGVSQQLIAFAELNKCRCSKARARVITFLEGKGLEFTPDGVRRKPST